MTLEEFERRKNARRALDLEKFEMVLRRQFTEVEVNIYKAAWNDGCLFAIEEELERLKKERGNG